MADAYIGEIRLFAGNFAPSGWAFCEGQTLLIQQYTTLYAIIGKQYGGDGQTNFKLPDLRGRAPISQGTGAGLTPRDMGDAVGESSVTLLETQMPSHNHTPNALHAQGNSNSPQNDYWAETVPQGKKGTKVNLYDTTANVLMNPTALTSQGGSQPHNNMQPYVAINYIICLTDGEFPVHS